MRPHPKIIDRIVERLRNSQRFCVVGHVRPDGDFYFNNTGYFNFDLYRRALNFNGHLDDAGHFYLSGFCFATGSKHEPKQK